MTTAAGLDESRVEVERLSLLPSVYRDANKTVVRNRTNFILDKIVRLAKAPFARLLHFQRTRVSMVLHNTYNSEAVLVYARFARWLAAQDARMVYSIATVINGEAFVQNEFARLAHAPSQATLRTMTSPSARAVAYVRCLGEKSNSSEVDRLARALLTELEHHPTSTFLALPAVSLLRAYFTCTLSLPARSDVDTQVHAWLDSVQMPKNGFLYRRHLGLDGTGPGGQSQPPARSGGGTKRPRASEVEEEEAEEEDTGSADEGSGDNDSAFEASPIRRSLPAGAAAGAASSRSVKVADPPKRYPRQPNQYAIKATDKAVVKIMGGVVENLVVPPTKRHPGRVGALTAAAAAATAADGPAVKQPRARAPPSTVASSDSDSDSPAAQQRSARRSTGGGAAAEDAHRIRSASAKKHASRGRSYIPRDNGQQIGPFSQYRLGAYTPAVFLASPMRCCLRRMAFVLHRDGTTRRQVARMIGVSQSKISRLLHGRSPFRNADEEFHLRHWLYQQEKQFVQSILASDLVTKQQQQRGSSTAQQANVLDFHRLPAPLNAISPPSQFVLYLHFLLPLDARTEIDLLVGQALGWDTREWFLRDEEAEELRGEEEEEEGMVLLQHLPQPQYDVAMAPPAAVRAEGQEEDQPGRMHKRVKHTRAAVKSEGASVEEPSSAPTPAMPSVAPPVSFSGVDAWYRVTNEQIRLRLVALVATTSTSQTSISRLLVVSSATISMLLRGVHRFTTLEEYLGKLKRMGRMVDRIIVAKALALMGGPTSDDGDDEHDKVEKDESTPSALEGEDDFAVHGAAAAAAAAGQPHAPDRKYVELLGLEDEEEVDAMVVEADTPEKMHTAMLAELVALLAHADIPMETEADARPRVEGAIQPLSLRSWLQFTCSFDDRSQVDRVLIPWIERWTSTAPGEEHTCFPLRHQLVQTYQTFEELLRGEWKDCAETTTDALDGVFSNDAPAAAVAAEAVKPESIDAPMATDTDDQPLDGAKDPQARNDAEEAGIKTETSTAAAAAATHALPADAMVDQADAPVPVPPIAADAQQPDSTAMMDIVD